MSDAPRPPRTRTGALIVLLATLLGALVLIRIGARSDDAHDIRGSTMGTSYSVRIDAELPDDEWTDLEREIQEQLDRVDGLLSTYDDSSAVSRFNRLAGSEPFDAPTELFEVLSLARDVAARSGGAFDVTVAPLIEAWGFGTGEPRSRPPGEAVLAEARASVGWDRIVLDARTGMVAKSDPGVTVDLSGIAKGYGVELVAAALLRRGLTSFLVEVGGDLKAIGSRRDGTPWRIGLERPDPSDRDLFTTIEVVDAAVATSGDYRDFFEADGVRYAHIVDPRSGRPIPYRDIAVTVVHDHAALADAWATALTVLGPDEGIPVAEEHAIAALYVVLVEDAYEARATPAFTERVGPVD